MFKFDKSQYRARRDRGIRGQEDRSEMLPPLAKFTKEDLEKGICGEKQVGQERTSGVTMHMGKGGMFAVTRRMKRIKERSRIYRDRSIKTKDGEIKRIEDTTGRLLTRSGAHHAQNDEKNPKPKLPLHDPTKSNHQRLKERQNAAN